MIDIIGEDDLGVFEVASEGVRVEVFGIVIVGKLLKLGLATFDGIVDVAKNEGDGNHEGAGADHGDEASFAPGETGGLRRFAGVAGWPRGGASIAGGELGGIFRGSCGAKGIVGGGFLRF